MVDQSTKQFAVISLVYREEMYKIKQGFEGKYWEEEDPRILDLLVLYAGIELIMRILFKIIENYNFSAQPLICVLFLVLNLLSYLFKVFYL